MPVAEAFGKSILFFHIPKCAGKSVARFLSDNGRVTGDKYLKAYHRRIRLRHLHAQSLEQIYTAAAFDWVFATVRHPVQRMLSEYRYQRRKGLLHPQNLMSFDVWIRYSFWRARRDPYYRENHFRPQSEFLTFGAEVFRLEDGLDRLEARFLEVTGQPSCNPISSENTSPADAAEASADDEVLIRARYRAAFEAFDYD